MPIPKNIKKRMLNIIANAEKKSQKNNFYIFSEGKKLPEIPEKSLVVITTDYE